MARDNLGEVVNWLGLLTGSLGKIALDVILMASTEVAELAEPFVKGRGASSTMPQKRNPISCEVMIGAAKTVRHLAGLALDGAVQDFERATGPWQAEWVALPEAFLHTAGAVSQAVFMLSGLEVDTARMKQNLDLTCGLIFSQSVLLALTKKGMRREDAYAAVQGEAMRVWQERTDFKGVLLKNPAITAVLSKEELDAIFDVKKSIRHVDTIFQRLGLA